MICPVCKLEYSDENAECEQCLASDDLSDDLPDKFNDDYSSECQHCPSCGARALGEMNFCQQCGEASDQEVSWVIGACLNCGENWQNFWQFCRTCGVARANALLDESIGLPQHFPVYVPSLGSSQAFSQASFKSRHRFLYCPYCATELAADLIFCNQCGNQVASPDIETLSAVRESSQRTEIKSFIPQGSDADYGPTQLALEPDKSESVFQSDDATASNTDQSKSVSDEPEDREKRFAKWPIAASVFLILIILFFAILLVSETLISDLFHKLLS